MLAYSCRYGCGHVHVQWGWIVIALLAGAALMFARDWLRKPRGPRKPGAEQDSRADRNSP
jgi:hypothetical protein